MYCKCDGDDVIIHGQGHNLLYRQKTASSKVLHFGSLWPSGSIANCALDLTPRIDNRYGCFRSHSCTVSNCWPTTEFQQIELCGLFVVQIQREIASSHLRFGCVSTASYDERLVRPVGSHVLAPAGLAGSRCRRTCGSQSACSAGSGSTSPLLSSRCSPGKKHVGEIMTD